MTEQYDHDVQLRSVSLAHDAAVLRLGDGALVLSCGCNPRQIARAPYEGTANSLLENAANLAVLGAAPVCIVNCLNFASPVHPEIYWQIEQCILGLGDMARRMRVPVVGGNVSLYNEGPEGPIYPTPVVGMVGELPDPERAASSAFAREGDAIALLGPFSPSLAGSELAKLRGELDMGLPQPDVAAVTAACAAVRDAVRAGRVASAHDISDGGLACALAESAIGAGLGCRVDLAPLLERGCTAEQALFGEGAGGFIVSGERPALEALAAGDVEVLILGEVGGDAIEIEAAGISASVPLADATRAWHSLASRLEGN